ncbi:MAG: binding protein, excisionase family [Dehalococcoidia bacterium]|nr:binding protein, excisionase family [Dehalococcoidia bacterium]
MANRRGVSSLLTTSDVARLLNVHINTVRRWSNYGEIKVYRIGSRGDRRFRREDITSFLAQHSKTGNGEGAPAREEAVAAAAGRQER